MTLQTYTDAFISTTGEGFTYVGTKLKIFYNIYYQL